MAINSTHQAAAYEAVRLAQLNAHKGTMASSAKNALADAESLFEKGDFESAQRRALHSLQYSLGIFAVETNSVKATAVSLGVRCL